MPAVAVERSEAEEWEGGAQQSDQSSFTITRTVEDFPG